MSFGAALRRIKYSIKKEDDAERDRTDGMLKAVEATRQAVLDFVDTLAASNDAASKMNQALADLYGGSGGSGGGGGDDSAGDGAGGGSHVVAGRLQPVLETLAIRSSGHFLGNTKVVDGTMAEMNTALDPPLYSIAERLKAMKADCVERDNTIKEISYYQGKLEKLAARPDAKDPDRASRNQTKKTDLETKLAGLEAKIADDQASIAEDMNKVLDAPLENFLRITAGFYKTSTECYNNALAQSKARATSHAMRSSFGEGTPGFGSNSSRALTATRRLSTASAMSGSRMSVRSSARLSGADCVAADHSYTAQRDDELSFAAGDVFVCLSQGRGNGWWVGRHGASYGLFPSAFVGRARVEPEPGRDVAYAAYDFDTEDSSELVMRQGERMQVLSRAHPQWTLVLLKGAVGYVPENHLSATPVETPDGVAGGAVGDATTDPVADDSTGAAAGAAGAFSGAGAADTGAPVHDDAAGGDGGGASGASPAPVDPAYVNPFSSDEEDSGGGGGASGSAAAPAPARRAPPPVPGHGGDGTAAPGPGDEGYVNPFSSDEEDGDSGGGGGGEGGGAPAPAAPPRRPPRQKKEFTAAPAPVAGAPMEL